MNPPRISVVIPLYNHEKYIHEAICSVFNQTVADFELIVINDGSSDRSEEIVLNFKDDRIRYFSQTNQGAHATINRGIALARGKYLCVLNSDDVFAPDRFHEFLSVLAPDESLYAVFSQIECIDEKGNILSNREDLTDDWRRYSNESPLKKDNILLDLLAGNFLITTSNLFCRTSVFDKTGGFSNLAYTHDYDFFLRLSYHFKVRVLEKKLLKYRIHDTNTIRNHKNEVAFEVGVVLSNFLINHDLNELVAGDDINAAMLNLYNSLNTFHTERMVVTLLLMGLKFNKGAVLFESLTGNPQNAFRKACIADIKTRNDDWENSQEAWKKWQETNDRLIAVDSVLSRSYDTTNQNYLKSQEAWAKWQETNDRLTAVEAELSRSYDTTNQLYLQSQQAWAKWSEANEALVTLNKSYADVNEQRLNLIELNQELSEHNQELREHNQELSEYNQELRGYNQELREKNQEMAHELQRLSSVEASNRQLSSQLEQARDELNRIHLSRAYKLVEIFRDFRSGKRGKLLLPLRLVWLLLPPNIKKILFPIAHYAKTKTFFPPRSRVILNKPWPDTLPLISVVISSRSGFQYIHDTLGSIAEQTFKRIEIIVLDDNTGISDNELNIKNISENQLRILRHPNLSYSAAVNKGIKEARGKYLCCLDSGDTIQPTYLEKCLYRMETEGMDICGSYWQDSDDGSEIHPVSFKIETLKQSNTMNRSTVFTKALWKKNGGFNEKLKGRSVSVPSDIQVTHPFVNLASIRGFDSNKIRVLLAMPFLTLGGAEKVVSQICGHLSEHRFHFTLVTTLPWDSQVGDTTAWFEPATTDIFHLPRFLPEKNWKDFVFYLIVSRKIQLIWQVGSSYLYELMPEIKSSFPHIKIADLLFNEVGHTQSNRNYNYCIDLNITENRMVRQWLLEHGEAVDRVVCIPSGINLEEYSPLVSKSLSCLSISDGEGVFIVGYFGRFAEEKCPEIFVEIANQLRNEKNIRFIMTGGGPLVEQTLSRIEHLGLNSRIQFFGIVNDIRPYLGSCDALILPSKLDGRPTAVLQALAMGVPVIASNVGSLSEIISNGENGFLCEPGDVDGFAYSIQQLFADPSLHRDLQQKARAYAASFLDAKQWFEGMENAFVQLVSADKNDEEKLTHNNSVFIQ